MAVTAQPLYFTLPSAGSISTPNRWVTVDTAGRGTLVSAATINILGALINKPTAQDQAMEIQFSGVAEIEAGAAIDETMAVYSNSQGFGLGFAAPGAGTAIGGICVKAASGSGAIAQVLLQPFKTPA